MCWLAGRGYVDLTTSLFRRSVGSLSLLSWRETEPRRGGASHLVSPRRFWLHPWSPAAAVTGTVWGRLLSTRVPLLSAAEAVDHGWLVPSVDSAVQFARLFFFETKGSLPDFIQPVEDWRCQDRSRRGYYSSDLSSRSSPSPCHFLFSLIGWARWSLVLLQVC